MATSSPADRPDPVTTALAVTKDDMSALSTEQRARIAERKNANIVTAQIAGTNWGKGLDATTQRAIGDWAQRHGIDANTEIHVLGGNIYLNVQFYLNRLVDLVRRGLVLDYRRSFINVDDRLKVLANEVAAADASDEEKAEVAAAAREARTEIRRRAQLRTKHNAPDSAEAIVVTELVLVAMPHTTFFGVKWTPHGLDDPVGKKFPQETALSRSARRALRQCVRHLPEMAQWVNSATDDWTTNVQDVVKTDLALQRQDEAPALASGGADALRLSAGPVAEPEFIAATRAAAVPIATDVLRRAADRARDPYEPAATPQRTELGAEAPTAPAAPIDPHQLGLDGMPAAAASDDDAFDDMAILSAEERAEAEARAERDRRRGKGEKQ